MLLVAAEDTPPDRLAELVDRVAEYARPCFLAIALSSTAAHSVLSIATSSNEPAFEVLGVSSGRSCRRARSNPRPRASSLPRNQLVVSADVIRALGASQ